MWLCNRTFTLTTLMFHDKTNHLTSYFGSIKNCRQEGHHSENAWTHFPFASSYVWLIYRTICWSYCSPPVEVEGVKHRAEGFKYSMSGLESKTEVFTVTEMGELKVEKDIGNRSKIRCKYELYVQPCLAELLGTCLFVFVGCASVIGNVETGGVIQPAMAHGLALGVLITVFGQIRYRFIIYCFFFLFLQY